MIRLIGYVHHLLSKCFLTGHFHFCLETTLKCSQPLIDLILVHKVESVEFFLVQVAYYASYANYIMQWKLFFLIEVIHLNHSFEKNVF